MNGKDEDVTVQIYPFNIMKLWNSTDPDNSIFVQKVVLLCDKKLQSNFSRKGIVIVSRMYNNQEIGSDIKIGPSSRN